MFWYAIAVTMVLAMVLSPAQVMGTFLVMWALLSFKQPVCVQKPIIFGALKHLAAEDNGPIKAPVVLNGKACWFHVDTGASRSIISARAARRLRIASEGEAPVTLGDKSTCKGKRSASVKMKLGAQGLEFQTKVVVLESPLHEFILGRREMAKMDIRVEGIPCTHEAMGQERVDADFREPYEPEWSPEWRAAEACKIEEAIRDLWEENRSLPDDSKIKVPGTEVRLPTPEGKTAYTQQYRVSPKESKNIDEALKEWLQTGVVERCKPEGFCAPLITVPKKDEHGQWTLRRPCADVRGLNKLLPVVPNNLPRISEAMERVMAGRIVTELDAKRGYHQLLIALRDRKKLVFKWRGVYYRFVSAPFGVKTLPYEFQKVLEMILADCLEFVVIYLDNIYVVSDTVEQHIEHLRMILERLNAAPVKLHVGKSHVGYEKAIVLGHEVATKARGSTRRPALSKIKTFLEWPKPKTGRQLRAALGFVNYLRDCVPNYAAIAAPLEKLRSKKGRLVEWEADADEAWQRLQAAVSSAPVLHAVDYSLPLELATDASVRGLGAVLYNVDCGRIKYIQFAAKSLKSHQKEYANTLRELLAVLYGLATFDAYLYGVPFTVVTDHRALTFAFETKQANKYVALYATQLLRYDFKIKHVAGKDLVIPDILSRVTVATQQSAQALSVNELGALEDAAASLDYEDQRELVRQLHEMSHERPESLTKRLRRAGQEGPEITKLVQEACDQCRKCQQYAIRQTGYQPLTAVTAKLPWLHLAIDLAEFEVSTEGYVFLLVITCVCTRFCVLRPLQDKRMVTIAKELLEVFGLLGFPNIIQSDNGSEFVNQLLTKLTEQLEITQRLILPYHPQANSAAESYVRLAKDKVYKLAAGQMTEWPRFVPIAQLALNTRVCARHNSVPFELMFGRSLKWTAKPTAAMANKPPMSVEQLEKRYLHLYNVVLPAINDATQASNARMAKKWAKRHRVVDAIPLHSYVMVRNVTRSKKAEPRYTGPVKVVRQTRGGSYVLANADGTLLKDNVPPDQLFPIADPPDDAYVVDQVLNHRGTGAKREYLVRWKNYSADEDSWIPVNQFDDVSPITSYWDRRQGPNTRKTRSARK